MQHTCGSVKRHPGSRGAPWVLALLLAAAPGVALSQQGQDAREGARELMCNRPQGDCAGSGLARQLDLVQQGEAGADAARVQPAAVSGPQAGIGGVTLRSLHFAGATVMDAARLEPLAQPYLGRKVGLPELEAIAQAVTALYRSQGYFLAQAQVPVQTIRNGHVEISVIEGRLGRVLLNQAEDAPVSEARVRAYLRPLETGQPLRQADYERAMLLLSDLPGIRVSSGLQVGALPGTTDLVLDVVADQRIMFAMDLDNHGVRETGRVRLGGTMRVASPLGLGDNLDARLMMSQGNGLNFGRLSWEVPLGASGLRLGLGAGRSGYQLDGDFADLDARGVAQIADVSLSYPLIRQRGQNLFLRAGVDVKYLRDELRALDYTSRKRIHGVSLGWSWERRDSFGGGGYWASSGTLYHGRLQIRDALTAQLDRPPGGRDTRGSFTKLNWQLSRLQALAPRHLLYVAVSGQLASKNLDAAEKFSLGGPRAVRAYASGEALVDQGMVATVEWRWAATNELTPFAFFDAAVGRSVRRAGPLDDDVRRSLRGAGIGVVWARPRDFSVTGTVAWRVNSAPGQADGGRSGPRLFVQLQKVF